MTLANLALVLGASRYLPTVLTVAHVVVAAATTRKPRWPRHVVRLSFPSLAACSFRCASLPATESSRAGLRLDDVQ